MSSGLPWVWKRSLEIIAEELHMHWDFENEMLVISDEVDGDVLEKVTGVLLGLWNFRKFCDSRWGCQGSVARSMACGLLSGLESMVAHIRRQPLSSDYYIHGFARCKDPSKQMLLVM